MTVVAVLGVLEADERAVEADVGDVRVLGGGVDPLGGVRVRGRAARSRRRRRRCGRCRRCRPARAPARTGSPAASAGDAGCGEPEPSNGSTCQTPNSSPSVSANHQTVEPSSEMSAIQVPCGRRVSCRGCSPRRPGVDLEGAGGVAAQDAGVRRVPGPVRQADPRCAEALLPHRAARRRRRWVRPARSCSDRAGRAPAEVAGQRRGLRMRSAARTAERPAATLPRKQRSLAAAAPTTCPARSSSTASGGSGAGRLRGPVR